MLHLIEQNWTNLNIMWLVWFGWFFLTNANQTKPIKIDWFGFYFMPNPNQTSPWTPLDYGIRFLVYMWKIWLMWNNKIFENKWKYVQSIMAEGRLFDDNAIKAFASVSNIKHPQVFRPMVSWIRPHWKVLWLMLM